MKRAFYTLLLLVMVVPSIKAQIQRPVGINLAGLQDWSTEYTFVDVFKQSRTWITHETLWNSPWSSNVNIPLRPDGYPVEIPYNDGVNPPQAIRTLLYWGDFNGRYPSGMYHLKASGTGQIRLWGAATGTFACPVDTTVLVNSQSGGVALEIELSLLSDPVHDIRFIMPGFEATYQNNPFNPELLSFLADFQVIRCMDLMKTNGSPVVEWADRNHLNYYTQTLENGVAYEHIIDLCNRTQKDVWICVPHQASDDYMVQLAQFFNNMLDPNLKVYVEYSNEVWNGIFSQNQYASAQGAALGYPGQPWEQAWQFYAKRSADMCYIFDTVFQDTSRLVKVVASQAANSWVSNYILDHFEDPAYNPHQVTADALTIAPYFAGGVANDIATAGLTASTTVSAILDSMELSLPQAYGWMDANKTVADAHGLELIAYEGGQHLVAYGAAQNDTAYTNKLTAANRNPRMQDLYCDYFNHWYDNTQAGMFCHFSSHGIYGRYGSWGVKEFMDDTLSAKYIALQNCIFSYNVDTTTVSLQTLNTSPIIQVFPQPSHDGKVQLKYSEQPSNIMLYDLQGRAIEFRFSQTTAQSCILEAVDFSGMAILVLQIGGKYYTQKLILGSM